MDESQKQAIKRAYSDLVGAYEAYMRKELFNHDWEAHLQTICDMELMFEFIEPVDLPEEDEDDEVCHN